MQWHASLARFVAGKCLVLRGFEEFRGPFHKTPRGVSIFSDNEVSTNLTMGVREKMAARIPRNSGHLRGESPKILGN